MNVKEIDKKIKEILTTNLNQGVLFYLMVLFEKKLNLILEPYDLLPFSSLIEKLELSEDNKKLYINYRNKLAHNLISDQELNLIREEMESKIIPFMLSLSFERNEKLHYNFEEKILEKLEKFANQLGFKFIKNKLISIGDTKRTMLEIDAIFESDTSSILFELKNSDNKDMIPIAIDQLKANLKFYGTKYGILILNGLFFEEINEDDYQILVIGELLMHKLFEWVIRIKNKKS